MWIWNDIQLSKGKTLEVHYFNVKQYFLRIMGLLPYVFDWKLDLVGISIRKADEAMEKDNPLWSAMPGVFNLWFIRNSLGMAHEGRDSIDLEYLQSKSLRNNLLIILKTLPALLYHQEHLTDAKRICLLDVEFYNIEMQEAVEMIDKAIIEKAHANVFFINADCLNKTMDDKEYAGILQSNDIIFPDGSGINLGCKMIGKPLRANTNGTDMFPFLCELAQDKGYGIYLLGAKPGIVDKLSDILQRKYPNLRISGYRNGYFNWETQNDEVVAGINDSHADMLFVAFGAPLQEKWISWNCGKLETSVNLGVGGLFDFYSETIPRAPQWMRELGIEWVYRLIQEPKRMWKRYIIGNPLFLYRVYFWKKGKRKR
ncbi:MAG TPA: WecB/TagA/CpsF family glycosyltransferase [Candidatus Cloacimonadota bacterium]|nr:WecB/TagA/CpsF family glycosyltransferase [Candidatus Cloacimonadota bacterium]